MFYGKLLNLSGSLKIVQNLRFASNVALKDRRIGVIGLGNVGEALVKNLKNTG